MEKVIEKVRLAYGYVVIFETPCSVPLPNSMYTSLLFSRWTVFLLDISKMESNLAYELDCFSFGYFFVFCILKFFFDFFLDHFIN